MRIELLKKITEENKKKGKIGRKSQLRTPCFIEKRKQDKKKENKKVHENNNNKINNKIFEAKKK